MKRIKLTQGMFTYVDNDDYERVSKFKWTLCNRRRDKTVYAYRGYAKKDGSRATITMHAFILGPKKGFLVDHIDGNGLNNKRSNLRYATYSENSRNSSGHRDRACKYKGVTRKGNRFLARITFQYEQIHLGYFSSQLEAHRVYKEAALKLHGAFAKW